MQLSVAGIPVSVQRKRIRNLHLYVKPPRGDVMVTAPYYTSDAVIRSFVNSKADWIVRNVAKFQNSPFTLDPQYVDGDLLPLWGEERVLSVVEGTRNTVTVYHPDSNDQASEQKPVLVMTVRSDSDQEQRRKNMVEFYRKELKERTEILLPQWEAYTGLKCSTWTTRNMKTRWGTCNTATNKITLNVQLAQHPVVCLEYVILHELCHTVVPNHGPDFKALETKYMPDWREVRKLLNEQK